MLIETKNLSYQIRERTLLENISFSVKPKSWLGLLGENGSGKTTLLDLLMGFKKPTSGTIYVLGATPTSDHFQLREKIAYLSEKVDLPGDCSVDDFLKFNSKFYKKYDHSLEADLLKTFSIDTTNRIGNLSAGEIRRVQIACALSYQPELIIIDEITAVLDIVGRRKLMRALKERVNDGASVIFATNILEGLYGNIDDAILLSHGRSIYNEKARSLLNGHSEASFSDGIADLLENP